MRKKRIFISSVQSEFASERRMLADYLRTDALFAKFFDTFIFEDTPAKDHSPEKVYIDEVRKSDIFILLLGDRLEVWNPGALPAQLSIDTIKQNHGSFPHNPLIADGLYYAHYIERMGTGIQDIVEKCVAYGLPEPAFFVRDGFVTVIYRKQNAAYDKVNDEGGQIGGAIGGAILTDRQQEIIEIIKINPKISRKEIAKQLNINESAVLKHLDNLKQKGSIERIDGTRGYWKIITEKTNI